MTDGKALLIDIDARATAPPMRASREPLWKYVVVSVFLAMVSSMSIGGVWSALRGPSKDAVLAISFAAAFAISLIVNLQRRSRRS